MDTFPILYGPDWDQAVTPQIKVLKTDFGDGSTQRLKDGLNNVKDVWDVRWSNLTPTEVNTAYTFLRAKGGGTAFLWLPPFESVYRAWTCETFSKALNDPAAGMITAKFEEAFLV